MSCLERESVVSILQVLSRERRPRLLLQTARAGLGEYRRASDLRRVLRLPAAPAPGPATVRALIALERELEDRRQRRFQTAGEPWRPARHVEVMIALMAETDLMAEAIDPSGTPRPSSTPRLVPVAGGA